MRHFQRLVSVLVVSTSWVVFGQTDTHPAIPKGEVVMVSLVNPIFPPLARQARITGEVKVELRIRPDGSVVSAVAVSGHPILTQAALNSAQESAFECRGCDDKVTSFSLIYSFQFSTDTDPDWPCPQHSEPVITHSQNRVTIAVEPALIHPQFAYVRARSIKCAYLWQCGLSWGGEDYYFYPVRSARCLGLWNCGHRLREPFATCQRLHRKLLY